MYHYDAVGNRIRKVEDGGETLYTYNQFNQLLHAETPKAELVYDYDERGNILERWWCSLCGSN